MSDIDSASEPSLAQLLVRLREVSDGYEFEALLSDGLRAARNREERDAVFVAGARRLEDLERPLTGGSVADRKWLRRVVSEFAATRAEMSIALQSDVSRVLRDVLAEAASELQALRGSLRSDESLHALILRSPSSVALLRELANIIVGLRGTGALALVDTDVVADLVDLSSRLASSGRTHTPTVGEWLRISRDVLVSWADTDPRAPHLLPILVRRLILETDSGVESLHFAADRGVLSGGWDGLVSSTEGNAFVPKGTSGWELSVARRPAEKVRRDLSARIASVNASERASMAFVAVILRPWSNAGSFAASHESHGEFGQVRVLDVDDVATWLERAPASSVWLREVMGEPASHVQTIAQFWDAWLQTTDPPLDANVVLAGRDHSMQQLDSLAEERSGVITIGGDVRYEEVRAVLGAHWADEGKSQKGELLVVDDVDSLRRLMRSQTRATVLVPDPAWVGDVPVRTAWRVLVAVPGSDRADVVVPPIDAAIASRHFRAAGFDFHTANELGELGRRSVLALRRRLALQPELYIPTWAADPTRGSVRRALLLGAWHDGFPGDVDCVQQCIGAPLQDVTEELLATAEAPEEPFMSVLDQRWHVVSVGDSWLLLGSRLTGPDLERFREVVLEALVEPDPFGDYPPEVRWRASLNGVSSRFSSVLKTGLARSLALLGSLDLVFRDRPSVSSANVAASLVRDVLSRANEDATFATWSGLAPYLPLLSEAAPKVVTQSFSELLASPTFRPERMFTDGAEDTFGSSSPHTYFLWALETLAWSPEHFEPAFVLLAQMAMLDPGGRLSNRPLESMKSIVAPWRPDTSASLAQRLAALDRLRVRWPDLARSLLLSMLPLDGTWRIAQSGPQYRDWKSAAAEVTQADVDDAIDAATAWLLADARGDVGRAASLVGVSPRFSTQRRSEFRQLLADLATAAIPEDRRQLLWESLQEVTRTHREFAQAVWSLPTPEIEAFEALADQFASHSPEDRYRWLFDNPWVSLGDTSRSADFENYELEVASRREQAVAEIASIGGLEAVRSFAESVGSPHLVGTAMAHTAAQLLDEAILTDLDRPDAAPLEQFAFGFFAERYSMIGWQAFDDLVSASPSPLIASRLLRSTSDPVAAARRADALGPDVADCFWKEFQYFGLGFDFPAVTETAARLIGVGRFAAALDLLALYARSGVDEGYASAIAESFEGLLAADFDDPELARLQSHDYSELLRVMAEYRDVLGRDRVIRIEWRILPALGFSGKAPTLHGEMANEPRLFVDMVELIYRPDSETGRSTDPDLHVRRAAENAYRVLSGWSGCPGVDDEGRVDSSRLRSWVSEARHLLRVADRSSVGDQEIGKALARCPGEHDGTWPCVEVRDLLEELASSNIEVGLYLQIRNSRGVTSRGLTDGGAQEWALVDRYTGLADALQGGWPRTSAVLRNVSESYRSDARREDAEAERRRRGLEY